MTLFDNVETTSCDGWVLTIQTSKGKDIKSRGYEFINLKSFDNSFIRMTIDQCFFFKLLDIE